VTTRQESLVVDGLVHIDVDITAGSVALRTGPDGAVVVSIEGADADDWTVTHVGSTVTVQAPRKRGWSSRSARLHVEVPERSDVSIKSVAADVAASGDLGAVRVRATSGDIRVDGVARLDVNTAAGVVRAGDVLADASCVTASGGVQLGAVDGRLSVSTASGDIHVTRAAADAQIGSASGDIRVDHYAGSDLSIKTISGDVTVGLPSGIRVEPDLSTLSGRTTLPEPSMAPPPGGVRRVVRLKLRTVSGDIRIARA
jgi:DUF4097 and DUF4098 domain-containing protein YvlB